MLATKPITQLRAIYTHMLISLIVIVIYLLISFVVINELSHMFMLLPALLVLVLIKLIWDAHMSNKLISFLFIAFVVVFLYSNVNSLTQQKSMRMLMSMLELKPSQSSFRLHAPSNKLIGEEAYKSMEKELGMAAAAAAAAALASSNLSNLNSMLAASYMDEQQQKQHQQQQQHQQKQQQTNKDENTMTMVMHMKRYNIFFVETSMSRKYLSTKQLCAIESAAMHNPLANIYVVSIRAVFKDLSLFLRYKNLVWIKLNPYELFRDTPLWAWWISGAVLKSQFTTAHISDAVRLVLLWKYGGFYSDLDTITIKSFEPLLSYSGAGYIVNSKGPSLANGFLHFRAKHPLLELAIRRFADNYNPNIWGHNGPILLRNVFAHYCNSSNIYKHLILNTSDQFQASDSNELRDSFATSKNRTSIQCDLVVFPQEYFYPYNNYELGYLFDKRAQLNVSAFINTYSVHFYGKMSYKYDVTLNDNNVYEHFASGNCELTYRHFRAGHTFH
jgi:lactosylceramide 4-alpha-galactosyltransferase